MNYQYQNKSSLLPVINHLPISQTERNLYCELYEIQQQPILRYHQSPISYHNPLTLGYQSNFIPAFQNKLPLIQSHQIDPLPFNYNLGNIVHQPGTQIRLGFDLSDFGIQEPRQPRFHTNPSKRVQPVTKQPQFDYFEQLDVPKIYLSNEQQYRIIQNKMKTRPSERDLELERLRQLVKKHGLDKKKQVKEEVEETQKKRSIKKASVKVEPPKKNYNTPALRKFRRKARVLLYMLQFVEMYKNTIESMIEKKRETMEKQYKDNLKEGNQMLEGWLDDIMTEFQQELANTSESLQILAGQDKKNAVTKKKIISLFQLIQAKLNGEFNAGTLFVGALGKIMNLMIQSYSFPPKSVYTTFEIKRLPTTHLGSLGNMDQKCQKMVLLIQIVVKQIMFTNIYKILELVGDQDKESQLLIQKNSQILVSIMHELLVKWMETNVKEQQNYKLDVLATQFKYVEKPLTIEKKQTQQAYPDGVLIEGIIPSSIIQKYLVNNNGKREEWVNRLQDDLLGFIDRVLEQLNKIYNNGLGKRERITKMILNNTK